MSKAVYRTTIKVSRSTRERLENLRIRLQRRGIAVTLDALIGALIDIVGDKELELLEKLLKLPPLEEDEAYKKLSRPLKWGVTDSSIRVDNVLYGL